MGIIPTTWPIIRNLAIRRFDMHFVGVFFILIYILIKFLTTMLRFCIGVLDVITLNFESYFA
jgi:hypothetical protein